MMKLNFENGLEKILDVEPATGTVLGPVIKHDRPDPSDDDFELSRTSLRGLIETGETALEELLHIARASEHPRAFEVVSTLIKSIGETTKTLADLHKSKKELKKSSAEENPSVTNNNLIMTTSSLLEMIRGNKPSE
jgi:hypothetical protein